MTQYESWSVALQAGSILLLGLAVFYYYKQARAATRQAELLQHSLDRSTYAQFEGSVLELSKILIGNSEVRSYFYDGKPLPSRNDPLYDKTIACAVFYLDFFDHALTVERQSPGATSWTETNWRNWIVDMFRSSPTLRTMAIMQQDWYTLELGRIAAKVDAEMKPQGAQPPADTYAPPRAA